MGLRMKNVNNMGDYSLKNLIFKGGAEKLIYRGELPKSGHLDSFQI